MIDSYRFGHIVIEGKGYSNDVIVLPERIIANWWRSEGHRLKLEDLKEVYDAGIDTLVIGTGAFGMMKVDEDIKKGLERKGIKVIIASTKDAIEIYNKSPKEKTATCLHLTC
jgi:hypothetical protein